MTPEQYFNYLNFALTWATNTGYLREDVIRSPAEAGHIPAQRMHTWNHTEFSMRLEYLGNGAFGIVWKIVLHVFKTNCAVSYALKFLDPYVERAQWHPENEYNVLDVLQNHELHQHRNILTYFGRLHLGLGGTSWWEVFCTEVCHGSLHDYLWSESFTRLELPEQMAVLWDVVRQILRGWNSTRNHCLMHRDIKLTNVFYIDNGYDIDFKLGDFGIAIILRPGSIPPVMPQTQDSTHQNPKFSTPNYTIDDDLFGVGYMMGQMVRRLHGYQHLDDDFHRLATDLMAGTRTVDEALLMAEQKWHQMTAA